MFLQMRYTQTRGTAELPALLLWWGLKHQVTLWLLLNSREGASHPSLLLLDSHPASEKWDKCNCCNSCCTAHLCPGGNRLPKHFPLKGIKQLSDIPVGTIKQIWCNNYLGDKIRLRLWEKTILKGLQELGNAAYFPRISLKDKDTISSKSRPSCFEFTVLEAAEHQL